MFAGYLQAAVYTNLNNAHGVAGWRWLFIVDAIITIPIALVGFFVFPDVPSRKKPRFITDLQLKLARNRLEGWTAPPQLKLSLDIFRRVLTRWHWYVFVTAWSLMNQNAQASAQPFSMYLKAKSDIDSVVRINTLPTVATAISIVAAIVSGIVADETGRFWICSLTVTIPVLVGTALLVVWDIGERGHLAAFMITGFEGAISPMTMGWATVLMANDAEECAVVTASMNAIGQAIVAGTQVVQFPASKAPDFKGGFISILATTVGQALIIGVLVSLTARDKRRNHNIEVDEIVEIGTEVAAKGWKDGEYARIPGKRRTRAEPGEKTFRACLPY